MKNFFLKFIFANLILVSFNVHPNFVFASETNGTIDPSFKIAKFVDKTFLNGSGNINFGCSSIVVSCGVTVTDSGLSGYAWGDGVGWISLNCANATCSSSNGNFKVALSTSNPSYGALSGYAWGENTGWINFGPFLNNSAQTVRINSSGEWNGYAWSENFGWIDFSCPGNCIKTDWRPTGSRTVVVSGGGGGGGGGGGILSGGGNNNSNNGGGNTGNTGSGNSEGSGQSSNGGEVSSGGESNSNGEPSSPPPVGVGPTNPPPDGNGIFNSPPAFWQVVFQNISGSFFNTGGILNQTFNKSKKIINSKEATTTTKIVSTTGLVAGAGVSIASALFLNPLSFSEIFLIPARLWGLLMTALGLRKRNRPWGVVYDSVTKQPLDPAVVVLVNEKGEEVSTSITDLDGRYGFLLTAGKYKIVANKTNYIFPSQKLAGRPSDELYTNLYFGEELNILSDGEVLARNIPMDPANFDWNEFAKRDQRLMKFFSKRDALISKISNSMFYFGFSVANIALFVAPKPYNIAIGVMYLVLYVLRKTSLKPKSFGGVRKKSGEPLSFAILRFFSSTTKVEITHKISAKDGRYYCLIPNGSYYVSIDQKNPDGSYQNIFTSENIEVKEGFINKVFEV